MFVPELWTPLIPWLRPDGAVDWANPTAGTPSGIAPTVVNGAAVNGGGAEPHVVPGEGADLIPGGRITREALQIPGRGPGSIPGGGPTREGLQLPGGEPGSIPGGEPGSIPGEGPGSIPGGGPAREALEAAGRGAARLCEEALAMKVRVCVCT